ncbi:hypothetical protein JHK82_040280 [Glycine max]|nr:hypothetical protein JHK82_040280 [Glycine max]
MGGENGKSCNMPMGKKLQYNHEKLITLTGPPISFLEGYFEAPFRRTSPAAAAAVLLLKGSKNLPRRRRGTVASAPSPPFAGNIGATCAHVKCFKRYSEVSSYNVLSLVFCCVSKTVGGVLLPKSAVKFERYLVGEILTVGAEAGELKAGTKVLFTDMNAYENLHAVYETTMALNLGSITVVCSSGSLVPPPSFKISSSLWSSCIKDPSSMSCTKSITADSDPLEGSFGLVLTSSLVLTKSITADSNFKIVRPKKYT